MSIRIDGRHTAVDATYGFEEENDKELDGLVDEVEELARVCRAGGRVLCAAECGLGESRHGQKMACRMGLYAEGRIGEVAAARRPQRRA